MTDTEFSDALREAYGADLDALTVTETLDVADSLRSIAAALPGMDPHAVRAAALVAEAATLVEHRAGIS